MNNLNVINSVEVKDMNYNTNPTENIVIGGRSPRKSPRTHYEVQKNTQKRRNQKVIGKDNDEIVGKIYPERQELNI